MNIKTLLAVVLLLLTGMANAESGMVFSRAAFVSAENHEMIIADGSAWKISTLPLRVCQIGQSCPSIIIDGKFKVGDKGEVRKGKMALNSQQLSGQPLWILAGSKVTVPEGAFDVQVEEYIASLAPVKEVVPVQVTYRQSVMGQGLVGIFTNTSNKPLTLAITIQNQKTFRVDLAPGQTQEIGYLEGWRFEYGHLINVRSLANDFEPLNIKM